MYESSSEMETVIAADIGSQVTNDAVPTVHLGHEVLTKHSTLQTNGELTCTLLYYQCALHVKGYYGGLLVKANRN